MGKLCYNIRTILPVRRGIRGDGFSMKMIVADDEPLALDSLVALLRKVAPEADLFAYATAAQTLSHLEQHPVDVAFLDIELDGLSGLELAERCERLQPRLNIVFVTGYSQYALDALRLRVSGYLLKPVRAADLRAELDSLRHRRAFASRPLAALRCLSTTCP